VHADRGLTSEAKALLLSIGSANIDPALLPATMKTTATAGPGAGNSSFFLRSGSHRIRLTINPDSPLGVFAWGEGIAIQKEGVILAYGELEMPLCHCPSQAYITVSERCIYNCTFCPVPLLDGHVKTPAEVIALVEEAAKHPSFSAISLTSGVAESPEQEVRYMAGIVRELTKRYDVPIGVSVYPTDTSSEELKAAGASEIKYNVETMDPDIFKNVCPGLSLDTVLAALENAVGIFGKNHVSSNFIIGLGESDACVERGVEALAALGVIPNLRPISPHRLRRGTIAIERPSSYRLIRLARINKAALERHGLDIRKARTMCLPCTGCDLVPQLDL